MLIWGAVLISVVVNVLLYVYFKEKTAWWEYCILVPATLAFVLVAKVGLSSIVMRDSETWGGFVTQATYKEPYDENTPHQNCTTDSKGNNHCTTYYTCDGYSASIYLTDSNGIDIGISADEFEDLAKKFDDRHKIGKRGDGCGKVGPVWETDWNDKDETLASVFTKHSYKNPVKASSGSLFKFKKIDKSLIKQYGLFDYPKYEWNSEPFVMGDAPGRGDANKRVAFYNGKYGRVKERIIWILVFRNQPIDAAFAQQSYWQNGNKNELVVCVGVDQAFKTQWAYVFSWAENEKMKLEIADMILAEKDKLLDTPAVADKVHQLSLGAWKRKHFKEFNYLSAAIPWWGTALVYFLTLALNAGLGYIVIFNTYDADGKSGYNGRRWNTGRRW